MFFRPLLFFAAKKKQAYVKSLHKCKENHFFQINPFNFVVVLRIYVILALDSEIA